MIRAALATLLLVAPAAAAAQTASAATTQVDDDAAIASVISDVYAVISGPAGPRDWVKFKALFVPEGRLVPVGARGATVLTPDGYIERAGAMMAKEGFFESEIARRVERYGNVAHVFSTYESRHAPGDGPFARGINSIQLVRVAGQWRVLQITWQGETPSLPIPRAYLPSTAPR